MRFVQITFTLQQSQFTAQCHALCNCTGPLLHIFQMVGLTFKFRFHSLETNLTGDQSLVMNFMTCERWKKERGSHYTHSENRENLGYNFFIFIFRFEFAIDKFLQHRQQYQLSTTICPKIFSAWDDSIRMLWTTIFFSFFEKLILKRKTSFW